MAEYTPYALRNLAQERADNLGGLEASWYTPVENFRSWPHHAELAIEQLDLVDGAVWYQLVSVRGSVRHTQPTKQVARHGQLFAQKVVGALARHTDGLAAGLEALEAGRYVALTRDLNGAVQLVGTPDEPLTWTDAYDSGSESQRNGYDWTLQGETVRRARPYGGTWRVSGRGLESAFELQQGTGGTVELRSADGRLLATVPAGRSVVLRSGFKLSYQIV